SHGVAAMAFTAPNNTAVNATKRTVRFMVFMGPLRKLNRLARDYFSKSATFATPAFAHARSVAVTRRARRGRRRDARSDLRRGEEQDRRQATASLRNRCVDSLRMPVEFLCESSSQKARIARPARRWAGPGAGGFHLLRFRSGVWLQLPREGRSGCLEGWR